MSPSSWVLLLDDVTLLHQLGVSTVERGRDYYRRGAVQSLTSSDQGRILLASVEGSRSMPYQTLVTAHDVTSGDELRWVSRCSCPMQSDCKHVAAAILAAREEVARSVPSRRPAWESALDELVRDDQVSDGASLLALQVGLSQPTTSRYAGGTPVRPRVRLRPATLGRSGAWVRTGASWRDLEYGYAYPAFDQGQRSAVLALSALAAAHRPYYSTADQGVALDDLGHGGWQLLHAAARAGIPLVPDVKRGPEVILSSGAATIALDVRRQGGGAVVTPRVTLPRTAELGDDLAGTSLALTTVAASRETPRDPRTAHARTSVGLIGDPAHGVYVLRDGQLRLAPFDRPLDQSVHRLAVAGTPLTIPEPELGRFLAGYYPRLRQRIEVSSSDGSVTFPEVRPPLVALAATFRDGHAVDLLWQFAYPQPDGRDVLVPLLPRPAAGEDVPRDQAAEQTLLDRFSDLEVLDLVPGIRAEVGSRRLLVPQNRLRGRETVTFAEHVLPVLADREDLVVEVSGPMLSYTETLVAPVITVSATDPVAEVGGGDPGAGTLSGDAGSAGGTDWFDLGVAVSVGGEEVPLAVLLTALTRGDDELILASGTWFRLDRPELQALRHLVDEARALQDDQNGPLRVTPWQAGLWEELVSLGVVAEQSERWTHTAGALLDLTSLPRPALPVGLNARLRPYQEEGYHWLCLLWDLQLGGILADDMGLGKTVQTLAMAVRAHEAGTLTSERPLLIVAPTSVVGTWASEAARFCPELRVVTVTETEKRRRAPLRSAVAGAHLVVTSYALLRLEEEGYRAEAWCGLVLDEAQFVKNHQAKTYQVARRLPVPFKLAITGTPLENSLMDLWSLLSIVAPGLFPSPQRFTERYRTPIESGASPELLATLRQRIRPLMLRRTKHEVASDLPPKIEQVLEVTLNPQHERVYQTHLQRERQRVLGLIGDLQRNRIAIFRSLTILRQLSLDPSLVDPSYAGRIRSSKIDVLVEHLQEVAAEGHRALVFSQFTGFLALVRERLSAEGIEHVYLDGRTRDRPARIAAFRQGTAPVFLISLKAGGAGLTLTEADYVFVLDPWWNPAVEAQAVDRAHRIGQDKTVMVYRLVATGTIEEKVVALQQRKRALFDSVVEADGLMGSPMTADDIRGLLSP